MNSYHVPNTSHSYCYHEDKSLMENLRNNCYKIQYLFYIVNCTIYWSDLLKSILEFGFKYNFKFSMEKILRKRCYFQQGKYKVKKEFLYIMKKMRM